MAAERVVWPDTVKGLSILWIVYFHTFKEFAAGRFPGPLEHGFWQRVCDQASAGAGELGCIGRAGFVAFSLLGYHGVGVFIVLSGFTLSYSLSRKGTAPTAWGAWYRSRVLRLFPLYWTAHLIYLLSPPQARRYPIDYRFILSLLGDRVYPLPDMSYYANAAWWFFGLLLQLYLVFPALHWLRQRVGTGWFLATSAMVTAVSRYLLLFPLGSEYSGALLGGALFTCRLFEFTAGMVMGAAYARHRAGAERGLLSLRTAALGAALYAGGLYAYGAQFTYVFADALIGCGLTLFLANLAVWMERGSMQAPFALVGLYSYGLYLFHQPYVIWLGESLRAATMPVFVACAVAAMVILAAVSITIERGVNALVARVLP